MQSTGTRTEEVDGIRLAAWGGTAGLAPDDLLTLDAIQRRVLWLATNIIHHANRVRPARGEVKVGGHQASSASCVSILTALYFAYLRAGDRVSIKPHASPTYHAVQYLLGNLPRRYLTELRAYQGLQAYPSRTKDVDGVDFSTGSVGLGAVAPAFAALAHRYASTHFADVRPRRFVAVIGDAELDEGNVWEAVAEDHLRDLGNVLWVVDLNRQSLDRVVPGIRAARTAALFRSNGWQVVEAKYGRRLQAAFARPGGSALRRRIDDMSNQEYQALIRLRGPECRRRLLEGAAERDAVRAAVADVPDQELPDLLADLGGHDLAELLKAFAAADGTRDAPTVLFAYTIKGWGLPTAGDPLNHSALLTTPQMEELRQRLGIAPGHEWDAFPPDSPEGVLCQRAAERLREPPELRPPAVRPEEVPASIEVAFRPRTSSQEAFGHILPALAAYRPLADRLVTAAPDVSTSTNLGGWINKLGAFSSVPEQDYEGEGPRLLRWGANPKGQHIELGISEMNLFMLLGQFGLAHELVGELLIPIGTVYDPFLLRGMDAFIHATYSDSRFIVVGTPSGITLSPEGGAHQSTITPSVGIELGNLVAYEPCFAREVEWILLEAMRQCCDRVHGHASYLRLSTRPIDQALLAPALERYGEEGLRAQVLAGGYRLIDRRLEAPHLPVEATVQIAVSGAMVPEAVAAARLLHREGVAANVICLTSANLLYRGLAEARRRAARGEGPADAVGHWGTLVPPEERQAPIVTVHDGASHALAFLGSAYGVPVVPLGVDDFGQSGDTVSLYHHYGIDAAAIAAAAFTALELPRGG